MPNHFHRMVRGEVPPPPVLTLLGGVVEQVDAPNGVLRTRYLAQPSFANPAGGVQGGMLGAMLDDLCASLTDATVEPGQGVATLSLNLSFLRPARIGTPLHGEARFARRGRDICHVNASLSQDGQCVAMASAVCKIVPAKKPPAGGT